MKRKPFIRAHQPEQKEERRKHLLNTAKKLLEGGAEIRELGINELARHAGMAKSNVYRYFENREALLLAVLWEEWSSWFEEMKTKPQPRGKHASKLDTLVQHLAKTLAAYPLLGRITAALPSVLEQNLSEELIREFKMQSLHFFREIAKHCASQAPELTEDQFLEFLHDTCVLIAGLYPFAHPAPAVTRVLKSPELRLFKRDYEADLTRMLLALARD